MHYPQWCLKWAAALLTFVLPLLSTANQDSGQLIIYIQVCTTLVSVRIGYCQMFNVFVGHACVRSSQIEPTENVRHQFFQLKKACANFIQF